MEFLISFVFWVFIGFVVYLIGNVYSRQIRKDLQLDKTTWRIEILSFLAAIGTFELIAVLIQLII